MESSAYMATLHEFVEGFPLETPVMAEARRTSLELGLEPVTPATAALLTVVGATLQARAIVEVGTGAGVATLGLMAGLADDGQLTSVDHESEHQQAARLALSAAGYPPQRTRLIAGDAVKVLPKLRAGGYDLVFVDADNMHYPEYLEEGLKLIRPGGMVILYHVLLNGTVSDPSNTWDATMVMRDTLDAVQTMENIHHALVPVGDGLLMCTKLN
ncbi:MAG: O-methyltransferase [Propionibacteriaceae bacterium]|nr:O-methyltransferase [Propionibacteriaceae bacterium]